MPLIRKRRATDQAPESDSGEVSPRRQRPRSSSSEAEMSDDAASASSTNAMIQKMVRLALSSEYSRLPIRRADISAKVLGEQGSRQFKTVFESAQRELREKFGMEMTELPAREKTTITQRRAAQKTEKPSSTNKSWILTSTLPTKFRTPSILQPTKAPSTTTESTYTALYTFIIAVISLNGGTLGDQKLERYLVRMNADQYTPIDKTEKLLQRLCKEGYIVKMRDMDGGEEIIEYMVGPRGKVEVGSGGVAGLAREVYGLRDGTEGREEFEAKLRRSLGIVGVMERREEEEVEDRANGTGAGVEDGGEERVATRRSRRVEQESSSSEEEEEGSDSD
ncbi:uncharacterized protein N7443_006678 [Penicillium atrosanguineum]|uniref:MAGE domain-containing protein n=1 Tax=Penicillium atrosanguineum TaxID=1132637 RepID=A0A9W9Q3N6_9EURO|nr:uncharacterized protein N7443_006678 [Penicillium atrosanguineum]KAJ5141963.1 hypothetical protein N7526_002958 [Penicillium atrosanguineum]KAJ5298558.1 hypothetical protein N7443_006678 [Penicillium atrosanguineum]KAJ5321177.1 hypothetical protein N7476_004179 [Penicillium atrosanguineum]